MAFGSQRAVTLGASVVLAAVLVWRISPYLRDYDVEVGDSAPHFEITSDQGVGVSLRDFRGKWVLLNFWATWCPPCVQEVPSLNRLHQEFEQRGLVVLGVSVDSAREPYEDFIEQWNVSFPTVRDPEMAVASRYGTSKYPETYLIDPEGRVKRKYLGAENWMRPEIVNYLRSLL